MKGKQKVSKLVFAVLVAMAMLLASCGGDDGGGDDAAAPGSDESSVTDGSDAGDESGDESDGGADDEVRLNQVQVVGSHNSYKLTPEPEVLDAIALFSPQLSAEIDYGHLSLTEQLGDYGLRQIEIDVYADPEGGRFANRPALELLGQPVETGEPELDEPGLKVLHQSDIDFLSSCLTFVACLEEVQEWSSDDPDHLPVMIMVETKQVPLAVAAAGSGIDLSELDVEFTDVLAFDRAAFDDLEAEILSVFDEADIITPDEVRADHDTLEDAVLTGEAWPTLADSRGRVLFSLIDTGEARETYIGEATSLEGRLLFTSSAEGRPDAAFIRADDPTEDPDRIPALVEAGYLVRTRTDVPAVHAVAGDTSWRDAGLASGAQYLSTDYYFEEPELDTGFIVRVPDWAEGRPAARCNPVNAPVVCVDAEL